MSKKRDPLIFEVPPFGKGELIPLKGFWFVVDKIGVTESGDVGMVLTVKGLTANEKVRRALRKERMVRLGFADPNNGVDGPSVSVGTEEADSSGPLEGTPSASDSPRSAESEAGPLAGSDNRDEGASDLEQSNSGRLIICP